MKSPSKEEPKDEFVEIAYEHRYSIYKNEKTGEVRKVRDPAR